MINNQLKRPNQHTQNLNKVRLQKYIPYRLAACCLLASLAPPTASASNRHVGLEYNLASYIWI